MTNLEWLKSLSIDELKKELMELYCEEWLMEEHIPKIKPCPVCKGEMGIKYREYGYYLVCSGCGLHFGIAAKEAEGGTIEGGYSKKEILVDTWNSMMEKEG